ncbi:MAG TPA: type II secretion system protein GspJ [Tepidisphaeraceae bacterium]|jgi:type II secretion system protein J|nr:type II secretion system protein GspJ [Tepidisphaeraceae bacterium]
MTMPHHHRRRHRSAFTLLELILSLGMVAMISLTLYGSMRTAFRARTTAENQTAAARPAQILLDLLQSDFESILPPGGTLAGAFIATPATTGFGSADRVNFFTIGRDLYGQVPAPFAEGVRQVELALDTTGPQPLLVRRVSRNLLSQNEAPIEQEVLSPRVRALSLRYYDGTEWTDTWDSAALANALPQAVQIGIEIDQPTRDGSGPYRMSRIVPIVCIAAPPETTSTTATEAPAETQ